jgi:hypothetical protein
LLFTLVKLKTTGHGREIYKGLLREGEGLLSYLVLQNLMLEVEELKRAKERSEVKLAMLKTHMVKEPMKCKPADPEKFKEEGECTSKLGKV